MAKRSNAGWFQRLLDAGSRTTYHGKIRTRGGKRTGTVRKGRQSVYKGVSIIPLGNGEFETSLDSSRFESKRDARRFVDAWKKQGNPSGRFAHERKTELIRDLRNRHKLGLSEAEVRRLEDELEDILQGRHALSGTRVKAPNPRGSKGKFQRCVEAVSSRGGARDPKAVCGAQERKYRKNPEFYLVVPRSGGSPVSRHYSKAEATKKAADLQTRTGRSYDVVAADVDTRAKHGYRLGNPGGLKMYSGLTKLEAERRARQLKAEDAKLRKMGGSGNYDSVEVHQTFDGPGRKEYGVFVTRRNPADAAMAVSEEFHGRKVKAMIPVQQKRHYHKYLAELGELRKLEVLARDGKHKVTLSKFDGAMLCANEDKNQLFIVDGDQSVNLKDFGIKKPHEIETLGECTKIEYFTDKEHLGSEGGTAVYVHPFRSTNENGRHKVLRTAVNPDLIYHLRDEHLEFSGGSYEIKAEGIDK